MAHRALLRPVRASHRCYNFTLPVRLTPPTATALRTQYPEFTESVATDAEIDRAGALAVELTALSALAVLAVTAHILALKGLRQARPDGGAGEVMMEQTGPHSNQFVTLSDAKTRGDSWYATTPYGREFVLLKRSSPARLFSVRMF